MKFVSEVKIVKSREGERRISKKYCERFSGYEVLLCCVMLCWREVRIEIVEKERDFDGIS